MARSRWRMRIAVGFAAAVVLVVTLTVADFGLSAGKVHHGVRVSGVDVGGRSEADAAAYLDSELALRAAEPVVLRAAGKTASVTATEVAISFETTSLARAAYDVGRSGDVMRDIGDRLKAWIARVELPAVPTADPDRVEAVLSAFAKGVDVDAKDAAVAVDGVTVKVRPSKDGRAVDRDATRALLMSAFTQKGRTVSVPVRTVEPEVSDASAQAAAEDARQMLSDDVEIAFESKRWSFEPTDIAKWISIDKSDEASGSPAVAGTESTSDVAAQGESAAQGVRLVAYVDPAKARTRILPKIGAVGRSAKDATFKVSDGKVTIAASRDGIGPDMDALARELTVALTDPGETRSVALRTRRISPEITTGEAQRMGIKERLSRFTTTFSASNTPRVANIHTLADAIDGTLIKPGGTFSFNGTVGPRTAEKGYQEAPAIVDGKLVPQLGGGICQVGTTLFNTVFESGLPVVERHNHSFYISHYPKGRDATVSWGGPDFKFRNDTGHWVLLVTAYSNSSLTIALYGTDPGYEVQAQTGAWENEKPYGTEETKDPTFPKGARVVEESGITGRSLTVKRIVSKNGDVVRTDEFRSVYRPKAEVVRVGTKPVSKTETATVSASP